jgi:endonuclease-3 related protein
MIAQHIRRSFDSLLERYGPQGWWPADGVWEIMLGAVLVQRTTWNNAARAIENLRQAQRLDESALSATPRPKLEELLKPAGFYRVKARRVSALLEFVNVSGGVNALAQLSTPELRGRLLSIDGIGDETADAILLYGFERPVFVVDSYARRLLARLGGSAERTDEALRGQVCALVRETWMLNELHALIVAHGKRHCRPQPQCDGCCLVSFCAYAESGWRAA